MPTPALPKPPGPDSPSRLRALAVVLALSLTSCGARHDPPSILLIVVDTLRADAVSAYGKVSGTTPTMDALAARGLRYANAFSNANWTLPSHASLFTGRFPFQHGLASNRDKLPPQVATLAERLHAAGYQTAGFSENPWVGPSTSLSQGFDHFEGRVGEATSEWLRNRRPDAPFFLFVNVMDAHWPYLVRDTNPFLPEGVDPEAARAVSQLQEDYLCNHEVRPSDCAVLRGLYLGGVAAADRKLGDLLGRVHDAGADADLITIVVSDHGEHFGFHGNIFHDFGLGHRLLHVPLIVTGLPGVAAGVVDQPVQLIDVVPSVLRWAGLPADGDLPGRPLPTGDGGPAAPRPLFAECHSNLDEAILSTMPAGIASMIRSGRARATRRCGPEDRVLGDMWAITKPPYKLMWYANYPSPQLFDISADPHQRHDLAPSLPDVVAALESDLGAVLAQGAHVNAGHTAEPTDPAVVERLRALGYLGGPSH
jgi:arylsulfatase A-like enzyme